VITHIDPFESMDIIRKIKDTAEQINSVLPFLPAINPTTARHKHVKNKTQKVKKATHLIKGLIITEYLVTPLQPPIDELS
jgi:hypothetical protein